jgi:acetyl coenzyme A synthetase (ADP forming)-like protein
MHPVSAPLPVGDEPLSPRLVLRDGSVATVRAAGPDDRRAVRRFFEGLSPESRRLRFFSQGDVPQDVIDRLCDEADRSRALTLIVSRQVGADVRPIAVASYAATGPHTAEVAFAVDDAFQGHGLGTALLERLAVLAAPHGITRFAATTLADNSAMLEVFRDSGFVIRAHPEAGCIELQLDITPSAESVRRAEVRDHIASAASLVPLLTPRAVAVVGVSRDEGRIGRRVFDALRQGGFRGAVYPVNPEAADIDGVPCHATARTLPPDVDLAVLAVPRDAVPGAVDDCAAAGVRALVVITAGYAEAGDEGRSLQRALVEQVRNHGLRMVGPNCMGLINAAAGVRLNASFSPLMPPPGRVALSSQSGALGLAILDLATDRGVGLSSFVSIGNKADVSSNDLLQYWDQDPGTAVILLYLESFGNPRRFARLARRIGRTKPIVALKAGRTRSGSRAAGSHTAALAASDTAVNALFNQSGVIRADTVDEMFDLAACLESQPLPRGRRIAIVTNAGGPGILAADACEAAGLTMAENSAETRARLAAFLPAEASLTNPVDMVASAGPDAYRRTIEAVLAADDNDAVIVIFTPVDRRTAGAITEAIREGIRAGRAAAGARGKPVLACVMGEPGRPAPFDVDGERVPAYAFPENAARALGRIARYAEWRAQPPALFWGFDDVRPSDARAICRGVVEHRGDSWLTPEEMRRVLDDYGLPLLPAVLARSADEAAALASIVGFPVVAKIQAEGISHKTEVGGVRVNLTSEKAVRSAYRDIAAILHDRGVNGPMDGVAIQPMIQGGVETIVGVTEDPLFGPLVAFGLGGIHVEVLGDVNFRIAPLADRDVDALLRGIRGFPLLTGFRGQPPADVAALKDLLLRVSQLAVDVPEIVELDLNPVIALPDSTGCRIVDARVRVAEPRRP